MAALRGVARSAAKMGRFSEAVIAARRAAVLHSSPETARLLGRILQVRGRGTLPSRP